MPATDATLLPRILPLLDRWLERAERDWIELEDGLGCYGSGYDAWGVQTNQKYLCAAAIAGTVGADSGLIEAERAARWLARARAALRFACATHHTGDRDLLDGRRWGRTWISQLGLERMMGGVLAMEPHLDQGELAALRRVLCDEARYCCEDYQRGQHRGVHASPWNDGRNNPESNLWAGALLWRCSQRYADDPRAAAWAEEGIRFLVNGVSVAADAEDPREVDGLPLSERHVGANFHDGYALDHHGYLNVGYMVICTSQAAFLHFDCAAEGHARPQALDLHQAELWDLIRRCTFGDGRLARIGGDSRLRYSYCQEYLLPSLAYAADRLGDAGAGAIAAAQVGLIEREAEAAGDGSFYGARFAHLQSINPYYLTRLESDRANALALLARYLERDPALFGDDQPQADGGWCDPAHSAAIHRSPRRFASFAWRANGYAQGLCLPPEAGDLAEWSRNAAGGLRCTGDAGVFGGQDPHRRLERSAVQPFAGGFAASGALREGCSVFLPEGWRAPESGQAEHRLAWIALPDDATVVCLQRIDALLPRIFVSRIAGCDLAIPNDVFNHDRRVLTTAEGERELRGGEIDGAGPIGAWACIDGRLGLAVPEGDLSLERDPERQGNPYGSIRLERLVLDLRRDLAASGTLLDGAWALRSGADAAETAALHAGLELRRDGDLRLLAVTGADDARYLAVANLGAEDASWSCDAAGHDLVSDRGLSRGDRLDLPVGAAALLRLE